jgi:hypothetical protein
MKKILPVLLVMAAIICACKKENNTPSTPGTDSAPLGTVIASATITSGSTPGDKASGDARLYNENGSWKLFLSNFSTTNGPDLHVYLSTDQNATTFIDLGLLKSTSGNQVYNLSGDPGLATYKYVLIWCKQYAVYFGGGVWK